MRINMILFLMVFIVAAGWNNKIHVHENATVMVKSVAKAEKYKFGSDSIALLLEGKNTSGQYTLTQDSFSEGFKVPKHSLPSGTTQEPPGPPAPVEIPAGDYNNEIKVKLTFEATEVDLFRNDVGITDIDLTLKCPKPGENPRTHEQEISVGVVESPGIIGETSIVTLRVRLVLSCG